MPFEPGQSGNPKGNPPRKIWIAALNRAIAQDDGIRLRQAAEKLLDLAADGDVPALRELGDRLDGKPTQQLDLANANGEAFKFEKIVREVVKP